MPRGQHTDLKVKKEILQKLANGEATAELSKEYGVKVSTIHNWVYYAKKRRNAQKKKSRLKNKPTAKVPSSKESSLEELCEQFKADVKKLILEEMLTGIAAFESCA